MHWNTKQLFVWVSLEVNTTTGGHASVSVWDRIIQKQEDALLNLSHIQGEYPVGLILLRTATDVQPVLHWNSIPYTGLLATGNTGSVHLK